jgi:hypothetical protein
MSVEEKEKTQPPSPRLGLDADHIKSKKERDPEADPSPTSDERSLTQVDSHDDLAPGDGDVPRDEHFKVGWDGPNDPDNPQVRSGSHCDVPEAYWSPTCRTGVVRNDGTCEHLSCILHPESF